MYEHLIFHKSCEWKIDTFIKSSNLLLKGKPPVKGQAVEFTREMAEVVDGWILGGVKQSKKCGKVFAECRQEMETKLAAKEPVPWEMVTIELSHEKGC